MDPLGYSANLQSVRALADVLPLSQLLLLPLTRNESERATLLEAVLLGAAGFLPSQRPDLTASDWLSSDYSEEVEAIWASNAPILSIENGKPVAHGWVTDRVRP